MTKLQRIAAIRRLEQIEDSLPEGSFDRQVIRWAKEDMLDYVRAQNNTTPTPERRCQVCGRSLDLSVAVLGVCKKCGELLEVSR